MNNIITVSIIDENGLEDEKKESENYNYDDNFQADHNIIKNDNNDGEDNTGNSSKYKLYYCM
jgi:hypothetical protein